MYDREALSQRTGISREDVAAMIDLGVLAPSGGELFTDGDLRRAMVVQDLARSGLPLDSLAEAMREAHLSLDFVDEPGFERVATLSGQTFDQLAHTSGIPIGLLMTIREAMGFSQPEPTDVVRTDELQVAGLAGVMLEAGVPQLEVERALWTYGDSARRIAETETFWFDEYILKPFFRSGRPWTEMTAAIAEPARRINAASDPAMLAIVHAQQARTWIRGIFDQVERFMTARGLVGETEKQPAICFLDLTGYTRLTEQHGDAAAADVAGNLARLVQRSATNHGGRPVKWLGDGVMFYFRAAGPAVVAALEMVDSSAAAGLPPAHVGLHAGPVLFQEGDYYGRTVNAAARIADYARPGEVLVTREVADAAPDESVKFTPIGPVQLKGLSDDLFLLAASRP